MKVLVEIKTREISECVDENGDAWVRIGKCKRCGWCCSFHPTKPPGVPFPNIRTKRCAYISETGQGEWLCGLQDTKPFGCAVFPLLGHMVSPECGYNWQKKEEISSE